MNSFVKRVTGKISKLTPEQVEQLLDLMTSENELLDSVLESLHTGLLICNTNWYLESENKIAFRYIPITLHSRQMPVWELIDDIHIAEFLKENGTNPKNHAGKEFSLTNTDGVIKFVRITILPLVQSHTLRGYIIQIDDITEKRNQDMLIRRMENLAGLTNLAASVAHEIKNPLGAISIHIQLIQKALKKARSGDGTLPDEKFVERHLDVVTEEITRLNDITVNFLTAVHPVTARLESVNVTDLINNFADFIEAELMQKNIILELDLEDGIPHIMIDPKLFWQMLTNLAQNSLVAMPDGGYFCITATVKDEYFILNVIDTGIGMDEQTLNRLFEPYFTTRAQGTGLGLTMVYKIVKEFSGEINVKSFLGEGTIFSMRFPLPQTGLRLLGYENTED
ncbi:MAG: ATP-binding protein [Spirochaetales bacterium]